MKFIAKYIQVIGLLMLSGFVAAAAALYFGVPAQVSKPNTAAPAAAPADKHTDCSHATTAPAEPDGCAHSAGGCCSAKTETPGPSAGGCTRTSVSAPDHLTP